MPLNANKKPAFPINALTGPHAAVHTTYEAGGGSGAISTASATATTSATTQANAVAFLGPFAFAVAVNQITDDVDDAEGNEIIHIENLFSEGAAWLSQPTAGNATPESRTSSKSSPADN